jgi:HEAT repeat protein
MYPHERSLVERLANQPFALIGVNSDPKDNVKAALERENISWRSFWDGGNTRGPIASAWNIRGWPTIYVIDDRGVIRYKNVRGEKMDEAVDELLESAVVTLVKNIKSDDPDLRGLAAFRLGKYNAPDAISLLRPVLKDDDESVKQRAATGLALLGEPANPLLKLIRKAAEDEEAEIRIASIDVLGNAKDKRSVELISEALNDDVVNVRRSAIASLRKLGDPSCVPAISKAVDDEDSETAKAAAYALAEMKASQSIKALKELAEDNEHPARVWIAVAMHRAGQKGTVERFKNLLKDEDQKVRQQAVTSLEGLADLDATDLLILALEDESQSVSKAASTLLAKNDSPKAKEALDKYLTRRIQSIVDDLSGSDRAKMSQAQSELSQLGKDAAPQLAAAMKNDIPKMPAMFIAQVICRSGDAEAIKLLKQSVADKDDSVRVHVAYALSMIKDQDTHPDLLKLAKSLEADDLPPLIFGLANYPSKESTDALAKILADDNPSQTRQYVVRALSNQKTDDVANILGKYLDDKDARLRTIVTTTLKNMRIPAAEKILEEHEQKMKEKQEKEKEDKVEDDG